jgi:hypothetical protein
MFHARHVVFRNRVQNITDEQIMIRMTLRKQGGLPLVLSSRQTFSFCYLQYVTTN